MAGRQSKGKRSLVTHENYMKTKCIQFIGTPPHFPFMLSPLVLDYGDRVTGPYGAERAKSSHSCFLFKKKKRLQTPALVRQSLSTSYLFFPSSPFHHTGRVLALVKNERVNWYGYPFHIFPSWGGFPAMLNV